MRDVFEITKSLLSRKVVMVDNVGTMPLITADADRLVQIMYNLIGNAGGLCCNLWMPGFNSFRISNPPSQPSSHAKAPSPSTVAPARMGGVSSCQSRTQAWASPSLSSGRYLGPLSR